RRSRFPISVAPSLAPQAQPLGALGNRRPIPTMMSIISNILGIARNWSASASVWPRLNTIAIDQSHTHN
ncbi:hypothetical protein GGI03_008366, partial [Coemansia sp. RSA 2337]